MENATLFTFKSRQFQEDVYVECQTGNNGALRIQLIDTYGNPFATASINVSGADLGQDEIIVKDYSENEGMLDFLIKNNIVSLTDRSVRVGNNTCHIVKVLPESDWTSVSYNKNFIINGMSIYAKDYYEALDIYQLARNAEEEPSW